MQELKIYSYPVWDGLPLKVIGSDIIWNGKQMKIPENLKSNGWVDDIHLTYLNDFNFNHVFGACLLIETTCTMFKNDKNTNHNSYGLKHIIESNSYYQEFSKSKYLSNGELILAMILNGYYVYDINGLNCYFNILDKDIKHLCKHNPYRNY